jgi:hypothetical protein
MNSVFLGADFHSPTEKRKEKVGESNKGGFEFLKEKSSYLDQKT